MAVRHDDVVCVLVRRDEDQVVVRPRMVVISQIETLCERSQSSP